MKKLILSLLILPTIVSYAQEFESDLYATLNYNTLTDFMNSDMNKMTVTTFRNSDKHGLVEEVETKYRKGRLFEDRISFTSKYTEHYMVEDRKRSQGRYDLKDDQLIRYQRTDFDNDNMRKLTYYHFYVYDNRVLERESIRIWEYGQGSVEVDTTVYVDSAVFNVERIESGYKQTVSDNPDNYSLYEIENDRLTILTNVLGDFKEVTSFTYDSKGHLVRINRKITNKNGKSSTTTSELHYNIHGLLSEVRFYDDQQQLLEKKIYEYK